MLVVESGSHDSLRPYGGAQREAHLVLVVTWNINVAYLLCACKDIGAKQDEDGDVFFHIADGLFKQVTNGGKCHLATFVEDTRGAVTVAQTYREVVGYAVAGLRINQESHIEGVDHEIGSHV